MKQKLLVAIMLIMGVVFQSFSQQKVGRIIAHKQKGQEVIFSCEQGKSVKLSIVTNNIIRVQVSPDGEFKPSMMIKLGFVKDTFAHVNYTLNDEGKQFRISTAYLTALVDKESFAITLQDKARNLIVRSNQKFGIQTGDKNVLNFDMPADEHFFGFGFMRETLDARGSKLSFKRKYRWKGATVPYFMSTRGYAFYSNSAYNHDFDFTPKSDDGTGDYYTISSNGNAIDFYLIYGPDFPKLLDRYTDLTGKSMLVPRWAFGLEYRLRYYGDQKDLLAVAKDFRNKEIPCDIMALEPGWEEVPYSMKWKWSSKRFPEPKKMIDKLASMGFKLDLWESGIASTKNITDLKSRQKWYEKRKDIVDMGVNMFKQDDPYPRSIISSELLDPVFAHQKFKDNKLSAEELNNVANSLYTETLFNEFRKQTGKRAVVMFHAYNASVASHRWPFQWAGDFQAENGMLNACLSGHAMVSYDIRNPYAAGWHQGFFTPFAVVDSWAYYRDPWLYSESIEESCRLYACLRSRLVPYLYSSLYQSHIKGMPIERPMVLNYSNDPITYQMKSQFMVGDWLLLALSDVDDSPAGEKIDYWTGSQKGNHGRIYLPEGKWINYWNGEEKNIAKSQWVQDDWPEYLGGLLYVKAGAIIPMGQVKNYIDETKDEVVVLDVYPYKTSSYHLYEDDGISYRYETGESAITDIESDQSGNKVKLSISTRKGSYKGMPEKRTFIVKIHSLLKPKNIIVDGVKLNCFSNANDLIYNEKSNGWYYDSESKKTIVKLDKGWKYQKGESSGDPLATIPLTAKNECIQLQDNAVFPNSNRDILVVYPEKAVIEFIPNISTLPADGLSLAQLKIYFSNLTGKVGKLKLNIKGSATFRNGVTEKTLDSSTENSIEIQAGTHEGLAIITVSGKRIENGIFEFPIYGKPAHLMLEKSPDVLIADGQSTLNLCVKLFDKNQTQIPIASSPVLVKVIGEALFDNGFKKDNVFVKSGLASIKLKSTATPGFIKVTASFLGLKDVEIEMASAKGEMQVRINPPEKVKLDSEGIWIPDQVDVFVNFKANDQWVKTVSNKVILNVYSKQNKLLATYAQDAKNGEAIFKDITYYKRPAQCLFEIKSEGYETVTRKVFANTWDLDSNTKAQNKAAH